MSLNEEDILSAFVDDPQRLLATAAAVDETRGDMLHAFLRLWRRGCLKIVVTGEGLSEIARDGLVRVDGRDHVQTCEVVRLASRGSLRREPCTCGSVPP